MFVNHPKSCVPTFCEKIVDRCHFAWLCKKSAVDKGLTCSVDITVLLVSRFFQVSDIPTEEFEVCV